MTTWSDHLLVRFFRTGADRERLGDATAIASRYRKLQWLTFVGVTVGYGFFYTTRLSLAVAKKSMIDAGVTSADQLGVIGSALLFAYAIGKFGNGFLADRAHVGRLMSAGLIASALVNLAFGYSSAFGVLVLLWALNGWFQSLGATPSVVNLTHWFSQRERGTRYSIWSIAHSLGEGMTYFATAALVSACGWRFGFWGPGVVCVCVGVVIAKVVLDRPSVYGLPPIAEFAGDLSATAAGPKPEIGEQQLQVVKNPIVWLLGLASATFYVTRYGVNSWLVLYLQEAKAYDLVAAGLGMTVLAISGLIGTVLAGTISDALFGARRGPVLYSYGALLIASLVALYLVPPGHVWLDRAALAACGFAIGGMLVFMGGLLVVDICPKRATGAAMGMIGLFAYVGAAVQDVVSGILIERGRFVVDGAVSHHFGPVFCFWISAAVVSLALAAVVWFVKPVE
ncbi:MAG: MFS transporter [Deltaproteobacteria bacterium]|nr:MFS transporter [Deltaproteobacteria bacterium]